MNVRHRVELSQIERDQLAALLSGGKHASRKLKRAQILLAAGAATEAKSAHFALISASAKLVGDIAFCPGGYLKANPSVKLHMYFHHLNSSQAFAFNLFFPFFSAGAGPARALSSSLGVDYDTASDWEFEHVADPTCAEQTLVGCCNVSMVEP
jgi:hypothetical protein